MLDLPFGPPLLTLLRLWTFSLLHVFFLVSHLFSLFSFSIFLFFDFLIFRFRGVSFFSPRLFLVSKPPHSFFAFGLVSGFWETPQCGNLEIRPDRSLSLGTILIIFIYLTLAFWVDPGRRTSVSIISIPVSRSETSPHDVLDAFENPPLKTYISFLWSISLNSFNSSYLHC